MRPRLRTLTLPFLLASTLVIPLVSAAQDEQASTRKVVSRISPVYPELARKMRISGTVKVEVVVAPNGKPKSVAVIGGNPVLAAAASDAVERWKWAPNSQETKEFLALDFTPQ